MSPAWQADEPIESWSGIGNNDAGRYDTSAFGGGSPFTTYSAALAMLGAADVLRLGLVLDTFDPLAARNLTLNAINASVDIGGAAVPEPGSLGLIALGFGAFFARRRKLA